MRKLLVVVAMLVVACSPPVEPAAPITSPPTVTTPATTAAPGQPFQMQGCSAPPVTFSALCEVHELIQSRHVDAPVAGLAALALEGLRNFETDQTEPRPRTLFCALPDESFAELCSELARRVQEAEIPVGPAVDAAVAAMANQGLDAFTYYLPPGQTESFRDSGVVGGVGILLDATDVVGSRCLRISETCPLMIVSVLEDNPGEAAGLEAGDRILAVDGTPVEGAGFAEAAAAIAGDQAGTVIITVVREAETMEITVERAALVVPGVEIEVPLPGVGYLRIPDFDSDIPGLTEDALRLLLEPAIDTIVVDLRDNPGGRVDSAVAVGSMFMDQGVVFIASSPAERIDAGVTQEALAATQRLIVLVNRGTASSAEILAGALRDGRNAVLVGSTTFGKDAIQIPFDLRNGGRLHLTVARWTTPGGETAGNGGLAPDRELTFTGEMTLEDLVRAALDATAS